MRVDNELTIELFELLDVFNVGFFLLSVKRLERNEIKELNWIKIN